MSVKTIQSGLPAELIEVLEDHASQILALQRLVAGSGGAGGIAGVAGCLIGTVQAGGLPAATDNDHPGQGNIMIRVMTGDYILRDSQILVPCLNTSSTAFAQGQQVPTIPLMNKAGFRIVLVGTASVFRRVLSPSGGIPAASGTTPGSAICTFYTWNGTSNTLGTETARVYNDNPAAFDGNRKVKVGLDQGVWWAIVESCT